MLDVTNMSAKRPLRIIPFVTFLKAVMFLKIPTPLVLSVVNRRRVLVHYNGCRSGTQWSQIFLLNETVTRLTMKILYQPYMVTVKLLVIVVFYFTLHTNTVLITCVRPCVWLIVVA